MFRNTPRSAPLVLALVAALFVGSLFPQLSAPLRGLFGGQKPTTGAPVAASAKAPDGLVKLTAEQITANKIDLAPVGAGVLRRRITVPARITPDPNLVGRVAAKVAGTVAELRKRLGDAVEKGEVVAVIDSREVADAKSEYLGAAVNFDLQSKLFAREKGLFDHKITAEQLFLKAKTAYSEARLKLDLARQKLASLDLSEAEIAALSRQPVSALRRKEIHASLTGRVMERLVSLGQPVGGEGQSKELYVISDLSTVEADLSVPVADLPYVREKQSVSIVTPEGRTVEGVVTFVNAMLTPETRAGHVIASFANGDRALRPGSLLDARIALAESPVAALAPRAAVQTIANEPVLFVRVPDGFEKRVVDIGAADDESVEIRAGVKAGDTIAASNTFVLKAELGKNDIPEE